jgi:hypothetical protein
MWIANISIGFLADFGLAGSEWELALNTVVFTTICNVFWPSADLKLAGSLIDASKLDSTVPQAPLV